MNKINFNFKNLLLTLVLTLALLLSGTATVFATNHKSTNAFADEYDTLYYFSDIIEIAAYIEDIESIFDNYSIRTFDPEVFQSAISSPNSLFNSSNYNTITTVGTIQNMPSNCAVVLEFMIIQPTPDALQSIVEALQGEGCKVLVVSGFTADSYGNDLFSENQNQSLCAFRYVDIIGDFTNQIFDYIDINYGFYAGWNYVFDRRLLMWELPGHGFIPNSLTYNEIKSTRIMNCVLDKYQSVYHSEYITDYFGTQFFMHLTNYSLMDLEMPTLSQALEYDSGFDFLMKRLDWGKHPVVICYGPLEDDFLDFLLSIDQYIDIHMLVIGPLRPGSLDAILYTREKVDLSEELFELSQKD